MIIILDCPTLRSRRVSLFEQREKPENLAQRQLFVIRSPLTSADSRQGWINLRFISLFSWDFSVDVDRELSEEMVFLKGEILPWFLNVYFI